jgi:pimeloyl-ACP methyl ester carboxylesterase
MADFSTYRVLAKRTLIHLRDWAGGAPPVVFLHSFSGNGLLALRLGNLIAPQRRLLAPDLRGRGKSDAPFGDYSLKMHLTEVMAVLDRLKIEKFVIAGHSFGAMLSVFLAASQPERVQGLILFDGGASPEPAALQLLENYYDHLRYHYATIEEYTRRFEESPLYQPYTTELDQLIRSNLSQQPDGTYTRTIARYVVETERNSENWSVWQSLPQQYGKVRCPALIVRAGRGVFTEQDVVLSEATATHMAAQLGNARVVTVAEAGHTTLMTMPSTTRDEAISQFLQLK